MKKLTTMALALVGIAAANTAASAQVLCIIPLMVSAAIVASSEHRELTNKEALYCGLIRDPDAGKTVTKKKVAKAKKPAQ